MASNKEDFVAQARQGEVGAFIQFHPPLPGTGLPAGPTRNCRKDTIAQAMVRKVFLIPGGTGRFGRKTGSWNRGLQEVTGGDGGGREEGAASPGAGMDPIPSGADGVESLSFTFGVLGVLGRFKRDFLGLRAPGFRINATMRLTDAELIQQVRRGQPEAFSDLMTRYSGFRPRPGLPPGAGFRGLPGMWPGNLRPGLSASGAVAGGSEEKRWGRGCGGSPSG